MMDVPHGGTIEQGAYACMSARLRHISGKACRHDIANNTHACIHMQKRTQVMDHGMINFSDKKSMKDHMQVGQVDDEME